MKARLTQTIILTLAAVVGLSVAATPSHAATTTTWPPAAHSCRQIGIPFFRRAL